MCFSRKSFTHPTETIAFRIGTAFIILFLFCGTSLVAAKEPDFSLKGTVVDTEGEPIAGADVYAREMDEIVTTDQNGKFEIPPHDTPLQLVCFYSKDPVTKHMGIAGPLKVKEGVLEIPEIKITLEKPRRFHGRVVDVTGEPVAGAWVGAGCLQLVAVEPVQTDKDGNFSLDFFQVPASNIYAIKPEIGFDFLAVELKNRTVPQEDVLQERGPLTLTLKKTEPVEILVEDESGKPLEGIIVGPTLFYNDAYENINLSILSRSMIAKRLRLFSTQTDQNGKARLDWIPPLKGASFDAWPPMNMKKDVFGHASVSWEPGRTQLKMTLPKDVRIEGSVRMEDGKPVPWAFIVRSYPGGGSGPTTAGASGEFSFTMNTHEKVSLSVCSALGAAPSIVSLDSGNGKKPPRADFVLKKGTRLYGNIQVKMESDTPYERYVMIFDSHPNADDPTIILNAAVDENGNYETRLVPGKYRVTAVGPIAKSKTSYVSKGENIEIEAGREEYRLDFILQEEQ